MNILPGIILLEKKIVKRAAFARLIAVFIIIAIILILTQLFVNNIEDKETRVMQNQKINIEKIELLKKNMSINAVIELLGEPSDDIGSGFVIFRYALPDGSSLILNFGGGIGLKNATIKYKDGKEETLIS